MARGLPIWHAVVPIFVESVQELQRKVEVMFLTGLSTLTKAGILNSVMCMITKLCSRHV